MKRCAAFTSAVWLAVCAAAFAETPAGRWEGSIQIPGRQLKLLVDLAQESAGAWKGSAIIPGLNVHGAMLTDIVASAADVSFAFKSDLKGASGAAPAFKARFAEPNKLTGEFIQGGNSAPIVLERTGPAQVEIPRASTAVARDLEGEWQGEYELFGYPRKVTLKLANRPGESASAEFVIVGKKVNNLPVELVTQESNLLTVDSRETGFTYEGRLQNGQLRGVLLNGPLEVPLVLTRSRQAAP
jgi:hypothetical protein